MAWTNASSNMLSCSGDNGPPGFITALSRNISSISPLNKILAKETDQIISGSTPQFLFS